MSYFYYSSDHRNIHSFPTRRSSDLGSRRRRLHTSPPLVKPAPRPRKNYTRRPSASSIARVDARCRCTALHAPRSEEHTSELQSRVELVCRLLLEKKKAQTKCKNQC